MIYKVDTVENQPMIVLSHWAVYAPPSDLTTHIFFGYEFSEDHGRKSSPIKHFDKDTMTGTTESGRVYKLVGDPGLNTKALYVYSHFKVLNLIDVTEQYIKREDK
jgi:hypothetical protein